MQNETGDLDLERRLDAWAGRHSSALVSPELTRKVQKRLASSLTPVKPLPSRNQLLLIFLAFFIVGAAGLVASVNRIGFGLMTPLQIGGVSAILAGGGMLFAGKVAQQMVPGSRQGIPLSTLLALTGVVVCGGLAALFPWQISSMFVSEGWPCALMEVAIAIPAIAVIWLFARRGVLFASAEVGATVAGLAAVLVLIPVQFHCMFQQAPHLLVWHAGTALLVIGIGALGGALCRGRWIS